mgnify:CR=1 FL=1
MITKQNLLELAIKNYGLSSATDLFDMIENQKVTSITNGVTVDYFTYLPIKYIGNRGDYIQMVGIDKDSPICILTSKKNISVTYSEISKCIRKIKLEEIF